MSTIIRYGYPSTRSLAPLGYLSPWTGLESEIDRLFGSALSDYTDGADRRLSVDLDEDKENFYVRAELPGVTREDIKVELADENLTVSAVKKQKAGKEEQSFTFTRSLTVPKNVQAEKVGASYVNGVLTVTLPKAEEAKPRTISVS